MSERTSRRSTTGLLRKLWTSSPAASVAVALTVLVTAALAAAAPRALDVLFTQELRYTVAGIGATQRDLVAVGTGLPATGPGAGDLPDGLDDVYGAMEDALAGIQRSFGPTLGPLTGPGRYAVTTDSFTAPRDVPERDDPVFQLRLAVDPRMSEVVVPVEGDPPGPVDEGEPVPIWLSAQAAEALGWSVSEARTVPARVGGPTRVLLSGTFEAVDPDATRWQHVPGALEASVFDDGNAPPRITGMAYLDPASYAALEPLAGAVTTTVWYPVDPSTLAFSDASDLVTDLRSFTAVTHPVSSGVTLGQVAPLTFREGIVRPVDAVLARSTATTAVVALVAAGPFGVAIAVLALATRLVAVRRAPSLALASARGASPLQLRGAMAIEGALLGIPAAATGILAAALAVPGALRPVALLPAIALGIAPAVLFAAAWRRSGPGARTDLDARTPWRFRWIVEVVLAGLAVVGTVLLVTRGLVGGRGSAVVDPLLVATPLLLALAGCIVVLRVYPLPLAAVSRTLARRDGVVGQLGSAIALRGSAVPVAPVLAMVVGVAIAVFSTVLVSTIDRGAQATADTIVGADLRVDEVTGGPETVASIAAVDGVLAVAGVDDAGPAVLRVEGVREPITLVIVDAAALGALRGQALGLDGEGLPVIVSSDLIEDPVEELELVVEGEPVTAVSLADPVAGIVASSRWVMADAAASRDLAGADFRPNTVLVDLDPGADVAAVSAAIADLAGSPVRITTPESALAELRASPAITGLRIALVAGLAIAGLLAVLALVLASIAGGRARARVLSLLSTLGLSRRQSGGLAAWELAPTAIVSTAVGALLGLALPFVVLAAVDLRPFTGSSVQPAIEIPWLVVAAIVAGFAVVVALTVFAVTAASRRASAAVTLRMGDEPT